MSQLPKNEQNLVEFIKEHRPKVPPINPDLESEIMAIIEANRFLNLEKKSSRILLIRRRLWLMPPVIAAGVLITWGTHYLLTPPPPTSTELASLEVFLEDTWDQVVEVEQPDWYLDF